MSARGGERVRHAHSQHRLALLATDRGQHAILEMVMQSVNVVGVQLAAPVVGRLLGAHGVDQAASNAQFSASTRAVLLGVEGETHVYTSEYSWTVRWFLDSHSPSRAS